MKRTYVIDLTGDGDDQDSTVKASPVKKQKAPMTDLSHFVGQEAILIEDNPPDEDKKDVKLIYPEDIKPDLNYSDLSNLEKGVCIELKPCVKIETGTLTLEARERRSLPHGSYFIRIADVKIDDLGDFWLCGNLFKRARNCYGVTEKKAGEVVWLKDRVFVKAADTIPRPRELVLTNHTELTCGGIFDREDAFDDDRGRLICRRRMFIEDDPNNSVGSAKWVLGQSGLVRMLHESEADEGFRFDSKDLTRAWRMERDSKIATEREEMESQAVDLTESVPIKISNSPNTNETVTKVQSAANTSTPRQHHRKRQYTMGDFFCGCGGASLGAKMAGFKVEYGIDYWKDAVESYAANFGKRRAFYVDITDFAANPDCCLGISYSKLFADVIHLSCPCQFYSPVHTREGQDDEKNEVASLVIHRIVEIVMPRVVTLEQTFGINQTGKFFNHFTAVLHQLVDHGYSVRWNVVDATEYGAASARKRLILIAVGPGEVLPTFPLPTTFNPYKRDPGMNHRGLPRTPTIAQVLSRVPANAANHTLKPYPTQKFSPHRLDRPLENTITCNGGESKTHPNGTRPFTPRELAAFQTFPVDYKFGETNDTSIIKQIGNSWPPEFAKAIFDHIRKHLEEQDGLFDLHAL